MIPESHRAILDKAGLVTLATIGPAGEPHASPVWFDFGGGRIRFSLTEDRQKYRNLVHDPRVSLSFTDPDNVIHSMEVRGTVSFKPDPDKAYINWLAQKYLGIPTYPMPDAAPESDWHHRDSPRRYLDVSSPTQLAGVRASGWCRETSTQIPLSSPGSLAATATIAAGSVGTSGSFMEGGAAVRKNSIDGAPMARGSVSSSSGRPMVRR